MNNEILHHVDVLKDLCEKHSKDLLYCIDGLNTEDTEQINITLNTIEFVCEKLIEQSQKVDELISMQVLSRL